MLLQVDGIGNTPRDYCSDYHPHDLRKGFRVLLPDVTPEESAYYLKRNAPPQGITVSLGPEHTDVC